MADRIVLNTISYHGHGAIENIVPELTARGYKKAFVCSDPDLIKFGVTHHRQCAGRRGRFQGRRG